MKRTAFLLLALCLLLSACAPANSPAPEPAGPTSAPAESPAEDPAVPEEPAEPEGSTEPELPQRERDWIEDIEFFREEIKTKHADPFYFCPEETFDLRVDQLVEKVGELSDSDIFFELSAIISALGDNHSVVYWNDPFPLFDRYFPLWVRFFDDKLYLVNYLEGYEELKPYLLHELVAVNGVNVLYLQQKSASTQATLSNWYSRQAFLCHPSFFDWAGCDYKEGYTFQFLNDNQEVESVEVPVITGNEWDAGPWIQPDGMERLAYLYPNDWVGYIEGENGGCIQWHMGSLHYPSSIRRYMTDVRKLMEAHPDCRKLAVDLRLCPGGLGNFLPIIEEFRKESPSLEEMEIYVLTSGDTMSAATKMIAFLKDEYGAVTVGEPTGQFSSFFTRSVERVQNPTILPHSQIEVRISDLWRDSAVLLPELGLPQLYEEYYDEDGKLYEWEDAILPDVFVHQDIEDIRQGKDSVLEWVMKQ